MRIPTFVLVVSMLMASRQGFTQGNAPLSDAIHASTARFAVERAVWGAVERLERPECGKVLSDFTDARGRTLQAILDALGETPRSYLVRLTFREAIDRRCQDSSRLAFTFVGSREVFVCSTQLWQQYQENPSHVETIIIHEMMHTLGLPENPPSSVEINARVLKRCWGRHSH
jgi:hypothetical protein